MTVLHGTMRKAISKLACICWLLLMYNIYCILTRYKVLFKAMDLCQQAKLTKGIFVLMEFTFQEWLFYIENSISSIILKENNWIKVYLILLCFALLHFTDIVVFTNWRQDPPPAKRKITTCIIVVVWNQTCSISKIGLYKDSRQIMVVVVKNKTTFQIDQISGGSKLC